MKRSFLISALCFVCLGLYAMDEAPQNSAGSLALPPVVFDTINTVGFLNTGNFLLLDGTYLDYAEMKERLLAVPENENYLNRAKGFEIGSFIGAGIGLAGLLSYIPLSLIPDLPNREILKTAGYTTGLLGLLGVIVTSNLSHRNLRQATRNYNLSVMGISIPVKKR
jgi:hypothetical protein